MALNLKYSALLRNAKLDAITTQIGTSALIRIYDSTGTGQPATPETAVTTQVLLAELTGNAGAFAAAAAAGVLTANAITSDSSANNTGVATWFRILTSGATAKIDGTVGTSGTDMIINNTSINAGQVVSCSSLTITNGNA
jgi:hypothetical protein